jgi:L-asparaginase II
MNLFLNDKYAPVKHAFLHHPELIGGESRLDTEIMRTSPRKLIAKVGAGGFLAVLNLELSEILLINTGQDNPELRKTAASQALNAIGLG